MEAEARWELVLAVPLPTDARSASKARIAVARSFAGLPDEMLEDAQLLVSEAVTDAVLTSGQAPDEPLRISGYLAGTTMRLEVEHEGRRPVAASSDDHLGLRIVDRLATRWGHDHGDGSSTTWFELEADPAHR